MKKPDEFEIWESRLGRFFGDLEDLYSGLKHFRFGVIVLAVMAFIFHSPDSQGCEVLRAIAVSGEVGQPHAKRLTIFLLALATWSFVSAYTSKLLLRFRFPRR